jgi:hypothetical protein
VTERRASGSTVPNAPLLAATTTTTTTVATTTSVPAVADAGVLRSLLGSSLACTDVIAAAPAVHCAGGQNIVDAWLLTPAAALARYRTDAAASIASGAGAPACASGAADERAWARPSAPSAVAGRYRCRLEDDHAAIWWTDGPLLAHAVAPDRDLARLFAWWRALPSG